MHSIKYLLILNIIFSVSFVQGQGMESEACDAILDSIMQPNLTGDLYTTTDKGIGSQYFTEQWLIGDVYLSNNIQVKNHYLRFNQYYNKLMWLTPTSHQQVMLDKEQVEGFCLHTNYGQSHCFWKIAVKPDLSYDTLLVYAEVLYKDSISLFLHKRIERSGYEVLKTGAYSKDVYRVNTTYYFRMEDGKTIGFKKYRKRLVAALFPDKKKAILAKFKELKQISSHNESDIQLIAKALNEVL